MSGRRHSSEYLLRRPNLRLTVLTHAAVTRLAFDVDANDDKNDVDDNGGGGGTPRCVGVHLRAVEAEGAPGPAAETFIPVAAAGVGAGEVIVATGTLGTPQLLLRSGVRPQA